MNLPNDLENWDFDTILELVDQSLFETEEFDFKADLPQVLDKTVCAFANSKGGFLIFGIKDQRNIPTMDRIQGISPKRDFPKEFGDKISQKITPPVRFNFKNPPLKLHSGNVIHVIHIPQSNIPHMSSDSIFWHRTNKGNEMMSWDQIRHAFSQEKIDIVKKSAEFRYALEGNLLSIMDNLLIRLCPTYHRQIPSRSKKKEFIKFFDDFMKKDEDELFSILTTVEFVYFRKIHWEYQNWVNEIKELERFPHADLLPEEQHAFIKLKEIVLHDDYFDIHEYLEDDLRDEEIKINYYGLPYGKVIDLSRQKVLREDNLRGAIIFMKRLSLAIVHMEEEIIAMKEEYGEAAIKKYT